MSYEILKQQDPELCVPFMKELQRQRSHIELIASENFTSRAVMEAMGSHLTNKYAEGYPGARFYGGCEYVDEVENLAIERVKKLFGSQFANVQPHSGSQANMAVYAALLEPGDTIWNGPQHRRSPDPRFQGIHVRPVLSQHILRCG